MSDRSEGAIDALKDPYNFTEGLNRRVHNAVIHSDVSIDITIAQLRQEMGLQPNVSETSLEAFHRQTSETQAETNQYAPVVSMEDRRNKHMGQMAQQAHMGDDARRILSQQQSAAPNPQFRASEQQQPTAKQEHISFVFDKIDEVRYNQAA